MSWRLLKPFPHFGPTARSAIQIGLCPANCASHFFLSNPSLTASRANDPGAPLKRDSSRRRDTCATVLGVKHRCNGACVGCKNAPLHVYHSEHTMCVLKAYPACPSIARRA
mgnify:CR=1 FL=1